MATYYFDPQALTNGSGLSSGDPFNTLPRVFSSIFINNDVILIKRGSRWRPSWDGSAGGNDLSLCVVNRIVTIGVYGEGQKPIISSTYSHNSNTTGFIFRFFNADSSLDSIRFENTKGPAIPVYVQNGVNNFTITNCEFVNIDGNINVDAINIGAAAPMTGRLLIQNNLFDTIANDAMVMNCSGTIEISFNTVKNPSAYGPNGDCISINGDCSFLWIHNNNLQSTNTDNKHVIISDFTTGTGFALVEDNILIAANKPGIYMSLPAIIRRNYIYSGETAVFTNSTNIRVENNIILQFGPGGLGKGAIWGGPGTNLKIIGNTIARVPNAVMDQNDAAIRIITSDITNEIINNVLIGWNTGIRRGVLTSERYNSFWNVNTFVRDAANTPISQDVSDIITDPKLNSDYLVQTDSPLRGAGLFFNYVLDAAGIQRQNPPTIGGYEYIAARMIRV